MSASLLIDGYHKRPLSLNSLTYVIASVRHLPIYMKVRRPGHMTRGRHPTEKDKGTRATFLSLPYFYDKSNLKCVRYKVIHMVTAAAICTRFTAAVLNWSLWPLKQTTAGLTMHICHRKERQGLNFAPKPQPSTQRVWPINLLSGVRKPVSRSSASNQYT